MANSPKPSWLQVELPSGEEYFRIRRLVRDCGLHTVCEEALCPNISDCFSRGTATFMILGDTCTRDCAYCSVTHGVPEPVDYEEPERVARAVREMKLDYVVITSVTRGDLEDGGAEIFARTILEIRRLNPSCKIEVLIPDFQGNEESLRKIIDAKPHIINHNLEVVRRLYPTARAQGDYDTSLDVLRKINDITTKSGLMVGLGETNGEIFETLGDLYDSGVEIITIGQYLQPSEEHLPVEKYYTPEEFEHFKNVAYGIGLKHVESGPLVRSSYHARDYGI